MIGGGASGLVAAIYASNNSEVTIIEVTKCSFFSCITCINYINNI
ncbi:MAG: hypothetical protein IJ715_03875 [Bacilli bacterium]|nr:hypothetical protein [Bacilli bacterium]